MGPQFGKCLYISEVNGARKVKSDLQVAINKNSDPYNFFSLEVVAKDSAPTEICYDRLTLVYMLKLTTLSLKINFRQKPNRM